MNTFKGPFRLIFEDFRLQFYIMTGVTSVLSIFYIVFWILLSSEDTFIGGVNFGPYYTMFIILPILAYMKGLKHIISFGGTRKQFLLSTFINFALFLILSTLVLNGLYLVTEYFARQGITNATLFHMGHLVNVSSPLLYLWIDTLWGIIIFGTGFFIVTIWYCYGTLRMVIGVTVLAILSMSYITFGELSRIINFIIIEHLAFVHILAGVGILMLALSYVIMLNGPLERGKITTAKSS